MDPVTLHDRKMKCITSRYRGGPQYDVLGALQVPIGNREDLVDNTLESVVGRLNGIASLDGNVAMEDFLKYLRARHEALIPCDASLEQTLGVGLMRVRCPDQVHRDIRVDKDH